MNLEVLNGNVPRAALYAVAAGACLVVAAMERRRRPDDWHQWLWVGIAVCVVMLGFGRELSLGNWITDRGRDWARAHSWYSERRPIQRKTDVLLFLLGCGGIASMFIVMRHRLGNCLPTVATLSALMTFVAIRAVSYHNVDQILYNRSLYGLRVNSVIEIVLTVTLIGTVIAAGWFLRRVDPFEANSLQ